MAGKNVIRQDIVQIGFEVEQSPFADIIRQERALSRISGDAASGVEDLGRGASRAEHSLRGMVSEGRRSRRMGLDDAADDANELGDAASRAEQSTRRLGRVSLSDLQQSLTDTEDRIQEVSESSNNFADRIKNIGGGAIAAVGVGIGIKEGLETTAEYQKAVNTLQSQTGATNTEMQGLSDT